MVQTIDIKKLKTSALESCCKESYLVLLKNNLLRIGAGVQVLGSKEFLLSIDVSINLCPGNHHLNTETMGKGISLAKELEVMGYDSNCREGQITCEINVAEEDLNSEFLKIKALIEKLDISLE